MSHNEQGTRSVPAGEFKNRCLALMDEVNETGAEILITKHGNPVSKLVPAKTSTPVMWGRYREQLRIVGDILSPIIPARDWEAIDNPDQVLSPDKPSQP